MTWLSSLLTRRPPVSWWDIADIVVVSVLIYEVLKLIRGTRAVQMALGAGVLVALFFGSRWSHLETVNWLVRNAVSYGVFAFIVLFQSDIRRALAHMGRAPFFRYFAEPEAAEESIEELVAATSMLAAKRIGAIIAIEREIGLRSYIESGIPLDAVLTYDLLLSIFQISSPLHDGAVIVQDDRVAAAACFLPLTVNPKRTTRWPSSCPRRRGVSLWSRTARSSVACKSMICVSSFAPSFCSVGLVPSSAIFSRRRQAGNRGRHS
jgi:diadenylate cyclase